MSSGMFRIYETTFFPGLMACREKHIKILFYKDGPDATVSVEKVDGIVAPVELGLRINGKPDAGTLVDVGNQLLLAHLPLLAKPGAKDVFVLGFGSGMTAGAVLAHPIERLDLAENCEPVIQAAPLFGDWNRHVLNDPRTHLWLEDARTVLKLRPQRYDVIITEPSNPWAVGVGSVFSREFYELAASRLKPGGVMAQWFHLYEMQDSLVDLVLRTFSSVFPYVEVWDTGVGDIVILGSKQPWATGPKVFEKGFAIERVRTDMEMIDIHSPEALMARQLASQQTGFAIAGKGPIQGDLFPILEYEAPQAFYLGITPACWIVTMNAPTNNYWRPPKNVKYFTLSPQQMRNSFSLISQRSMDNCSVVCAALHRVRTYPASKLLAISTARRIRKDSGTGGAGLQRRRRLRSPATGGAGFEKEARRRHGRLRRTGHRAGGKCAEAR